MAEDARDPIGDYCRDVEDYLTRVNGGHLVRIVGAGFELVRGWAEEGIPLRLVCRGIDLKAERRARRPSSRPLRIEFCDADVRDLYDDWRRAVGVFTRASESPEGESASNAPKRSDLSRHLERVIDRLSRAASRDDVSPLLRDAIGAAVEDVARIRGELRGTRGPSRDRLIAELAPIERTLLASARSSATAAVLAALEDVAARELASFRGRLSQEAWQQAVEAIKDRLLRERFGLPTVEVSTIT
jgi:hypothetical protein